LRTVVAAGLALAVPCGTGVAAPASTNRHRHSGTVSVSVWFHGSTGKGVVTIFTGGGRRIARHVVHQNVANSSRVVHSRFVLRPGRYTLKLTPRIRFGFQSCTVVTVSVRAESTIDAVLGVGCSSY
jgi:hypothetical protein